MALPEYDTEIFTTSPSSYLKVVLTFWLRRYGVVLLLPVAGFIALGVCLSDVRFLIVALVICLVVVPMLLPMLYFNYMLTPYARRTLLPKTVKATRHGLSIDFFEESGVGEEPPQRISGEVIPAENIACVRYMHGHIIYVLVGTPRQYVMVPYGALRRK